MLVLYSLVKRLSMNIILIENQFSRCTGLYIDVVFGERNSRNKNGRRWRSASVLQSAHNFLKVSGEWGFHSPTLELFALRKALLLHSCNIHTGSVKLEIIYHSEL